MYNDSHDFNLANFQPLFLYISDCMMFKDTLIPLHPKYKVQRKDGRFNVQTRTDYLGITDQYGLNIKVICGKNGSGKTTILRMLQGKTMPDNGQYTLCWIDSAEKFLCTHKEKVVLNGAVRELNQDSFVDSISSLCGNTANDIIENTMSRSLLEVYSKNQSIYDQDNEVMFDGFDVGYDPDPDHFYDLSRAKGVKP